jgi:hypothetical protein
MSGFRSLAYDDKSLYTLYAGRCINVLCSGVIYGS